MPRTLKPCGTRAAAARHRRRHEPLCDDCKGAERSREVARYWGLSEDSTPDDTARRLAADELTRMDEELADTESRT